MIEPKCYPGKYESPSSGARAQTARRAACEHGPKQAGTFQSILTRVATRVRCRLRVVKLVQGLGVGVVRLGLGFLVGVGISRRKC
jgi:hypothetical protein